MKLADALKTIMWLALATVALCAFIMACILGDDARKDRSRLTTLEREVAELRAQSRANVLNALPPRDPVLTISIP